MSSNYSLLLSNDWDIHVGQSGDILTTQHTESTQTKKEAYAIAQNVANAFRLFTNDAYYESEKGVPHFAIELKKNPAISVLKSRLQESALNIKGVAKCEINITDLAERELKGSAKLTLENGEVADVSI